MRKMAKCIRKIFNASMGFDEKLEKFKAKTRSVADRIFEVLGDEAPSKVCSMLLVKFFVKPSKK